MHGGKNLVYGSLGSYACANERKKQGFKTYWENHVQVLAIWWRNKGKGKFSGWEMLGRSVFLLQESFECTTLPYTESVRSGSVMSPLLDVALQGLIKQRPDTLSSSRVSLTGDTGD